MSRHSSVFIGLAVTVISVLFFVTPWASSPTRVNAAEALGLPAGPEPLDARPAGEAELTLAPASPPAARVDLHSNVGVASLAVSAAAPAQVAALPAPPLGPGTYEVRGRVVSASGVPVAGAEVVLNGLDWGGEAHAREFVTTEKDGTFVLTSEGIGYVLVFASHVAHGFARTDEVREAWQSALQLGDLALTPRGVLAGRVLGYGDEPLGGCVVSASPADEGSQFGWFETHTADDGTFRFAALERVPYTLEVVDSAMDDTSSPPVFTPNAEGLVLRMVAPSALLTLRGPAGADLSDVELVVDVVERVDGAWRPGWNAEAIDAPADAGAGVYHVLFTAPGDYAFEARARAGATTLRGFKRVKIGLAHHAIDLELTPAELPALRVEVLDPLQVPVHSWRAHFFDPVTGASGGTATSREPHVTLPLGPWTATVTPYDGGSVLPFTQPIDVVQGVEALRLKAPVIGGWLTLQVEFGRSGRVSVTGTLSSASGAQRRISVSRSARADGVSSFRESTSGVERLGPLAPGVYQVEVGAEKATVTILAGEDAELRIAIH
ncbi:MAG: carboxypeptidase-like regulatory domain-containing protein [Planctomycetota bacterium]